MSRRKLLLFTSLENLSTRTFVDVALSLRVVVVVWRGRLRLHRAAAVTGSTETGRFEELWGYAVPRLSMGKRYATDFLRESMKK